MNTQDSIGSSIFGDGALGHAHVMAHRMLDQGRYEAGHRWLGRWLEGRTGEGSCYVHVQWHMMVFELAVGEWHAAHARYLREILPAAVATGKALTDAPAGLWRLALAAPEPVELPWDAVADAALAHLDGGGKPFVVLHDLLALAGAGDSTSIGEWLARHTPTTPEEDVVGRLGVALHAYAERRWDDAVDAFDDALPRLTALGGSRAQNELPQQLRDVAALRAGRIDAGREAA